MLMLWSGQLKNRTQMRNRKFAAITVQLYAACILQVTLYLTLYATCQIFTAQLHALSTL